MEHTRFNVSSSTPVPQASASLIKMLEEGKTVEMRAIGAGAVNQMIKAFSATRRWFLANKKVNLCLMTDFATQIINEENRTVIVGNIMEYVGGSDE